MSRCSFGIVQARKDKQRQAMAYRGRFRGSSDLSIKEKQVIRSVHSFFVEAKRLRKKIHGNKPAERTCDACGVTRRTVFYALHEADSGRSDTGPSRSAERGKRGRKKIQLDEFTLSAVRMEVRIFLRGKKHQPWRKCLLLAPPTLQDFPRCPYLQCGGCCGDLGSVTRSGAINASCMRSLPF